MMGKGLLNAICYLWQKSSLFSLSHCTDVQDFKECSKTWTCDETVSTCHCFSGQPFCRCNNRAGEFYIDEKCSQRWTTVTFALVASLPGLTLVLLVGVTVYVIMQSSSTKRHLVEEMKKPKAADPNKEDLFPGITFSSDMNGRPPPNTIPVQQDHVTMTIVPNNRYSMSNGTHEPPMGRPARPYSTSNSMHPSTGRIADGRPHEPYSMSNGMRDPPMGGPARPYSNAAGRGQIVSNPYARDSPSRNPYDDRSPSPDPRNDYRQPAPFHTYDSMNQPYSPAPLYDSSDRGKPRSGFPRPQLNVQY
ncbi:uncharacterized protein zgc:158432 isoform X2 [Myxocyprinus asiaticus]|uniref:uncharacterized protein zgc:158432 isoform X2 n=1 Tax=Myxocyprinus asiaticus TaxID=70543 RepID=UPI00222296E2|nr:uncharacterized protein zgc:158432 isoform X2 [Myxocyprinus asiaticus]